MTEFELFTDALEIADPVERRALLARVCGDDGAMRERVERLLQLHEANSGFMHEPSATTPDAMPATAMFNRSEADTSPSGVIEAPPKELANDHPPKSEPSLATEDMGLSAFIPQQTPAMPGLANFEIEQTIGKGGMGIVLKARDKKLKRDVAIKVLAPHLAADAEAVQRFLREAQAAAAVRHDNVVTIHAVDEANGIPFLVMELINGESLQDRMKRGPLPADEIVRFGIQIASGLEAAHRRGLIHRDIKPANILLDGQSEPGEKNEPGEPGCVSPRTTDDGSIRGLTHPGSPSEAGSPSSRAKITDFGLARVTSESAITRSGFIAGTPQYMSPEQANGKPLDHRSDLFSLGSVLYSLCTGQAAFHAESAIVVLRRVSDHEPEPIRSLNPAVPDWLCEIIAKLMAKRPEDRIQSAKEVADLLTRCQADASPSQGASPLGSASRGASAPGQPVKANTDASDERQGANAPRLTNSNVTPQGSSRGPMKATWNRTLIAVVLLAGVVLAVVFGRGRDPISQASRGASAPGSSATESVGTNDVRGLTHPGSQKATLPAKNRHPFLDDSYEWTPPVELGPGINGARLVDHACISSDGLLMVMTRIENRRSQLWWSVRESERDPFPAASPLPPEVNSEGNDQTPFLSRDGLSLWFASNRPGGAGGSDLYVSRRKSVKDSFERPVSLGPTINTADDETSPFVTADELTLLFAAGGPRQIFQAKRKSKEDSFSAPQLLANVNDMFWQEFPRLSQDGLTLVLVVSSRGGNGQRLAAAWRPTVDADFSKPVDLGSVNRGMMSGPSLSGDETTLYFSTGTHTRGLWMSRRVKKQSPSKPAESAKSGSSPLPAVAPFDATRARQHQEAWAKHLGLPVEFTNSIGMKFRLIPPGEFLMGSTPEEIDAALKVAAYPDWREKIVSEGPQHKVVLTKPIYVGATEVTQLQYEQVMGTTPSFFSATGKGKEAVANLETGNHPVETVSWYDAAEFCAKLSQRELVSRGASAPGQSVKANADARDEPPGADAPRLTNTNASTGYRLPTEAEWEHACRAGTTTRFWSGDQDQDLIQAGRFVGNSGGRTHPVGELKANPFGLSDMHGNVWEWVQDSWDPAFYAQFRETAAINPSSPFSAEPDSLLFRGGNWNSSPSECRSSFHLALRPSVRPNYVGFRVVLVADAVKELLAKTEANAPPPAVAPFDEAQAKAHQEKWAMHLGVPVEYENSIGMKFRLLPPGEFLMGSTPEEIEVALNVSDPNWREHIQSEGPQHKVILTKPIYVGVTEVTQSQYQQVMGATPSHFSATGKGNGQVANLETGNHPVEMVSWYDAADFCAKLSRLELVSRGASAPGQSVKANGDARDEPPGADAPRLANTNASTGYRLPTEAEWEYACRAGTTTRFWNGNQDQDLISAGWHSGNAGNRTHAAGESKPNPFGLADMHGNVWEWVQDGWDPAFYSPFQKNAAIDPSSPFPTDHHPRPLRGGDWHSAPFECRSAMRLRSPPNFQRDNMGFRVVLVADAVKELLAKTEANAPPPAVAPFDEAQAKAHQEKWAMHLGVPVEYENSIGMKFRLVPPGEFMMGSTPSEIEAELKMATGLGVTWMREEFESEGPQHRVVLTKPNYVGVTEVTQSQYEQMMGTNPSHFSATGEGKELVANLKTGNHLVKMVSWYDAAEFCAKLSQKELDSRGASAGDSVSRGASAPGQLVKANADAHDEPPGLTHPGSPIQMPVPATDCQPRRNRSTPGLMKMARLGALGSRRNTKSVASLRVSFWITSPMRRSATVDRSWKCFRQSVKSRWSALAGRLWRSRERLAERRLSPSANPLAVRALGPRGGQG